MLKLYIIILIHECADPNEKKEMKKNKKFISVYLTNIIMMYKYNS